MDNKAEVREFLKAARARISPTDVKLPIDANRRVAGLRREEVAQLAGVSTVYYIKMERGDLSGVSESVLRALARALRLDEAETLYLFTLAKAANASRRTNKPAHPRPECPSKVVQLLDSMTTVPALVMSHAGDVIAANDFGKRLFPDLFPPDEPPLNHNHYLFLDERSQKFYLDWEKSAREAVAALRLLSGKSPTDQQLASAIEELLRTSEIFRTQWNKRLVRLHTHGLKRLYHPVVGEMTIEYQVLLIPEEAYLKLNTYLPATDDQSQAAFERLRGSLPIS